MQALPVGIQTFADLREGGFVYVDKTAVIHELVARKGFFFFSRPRRFGKTLLVSTLEALFSGRRDLFEGLAIGETDYPFEVFPILRGGWTRRELERHFPEHLEAHAIFLLLGMASRAEEHTNLGRMDQAVILPDKVFVFAFKLGGDASEALAQIEQKGYCEKFEMLGRPITRVGIRFDDRNIDDYAFARP